MKVYQLPQNLSLWIEKHIKWLGFNMAKPQILAKAIMKISNDYQDALSVTPWGQPEAFAAYLAYFFPLNYIRIQKVMDELQFWNFWEGSEQFLDFGCGPGTLTKALLNQAPHSLKNIVGLDSYSELGSYFLDVPRSQTQVQFAKDRPNIKGKGSVLGASYVLNELKEIPNWFFDFEKLVIVEPSTKQAFPKLLDLREKLIEKGFSIVAPCPHHHTCPLKESKRDWCHDRVHWKQPEWFQHIESHLPIKNNTLSFSYLIASKTPLKQSSFGRVVGDAQAEKGKTRWMICQGPEREFLSFLKRQGEAPDIYRGDRVQLDVFEKRGNEIRFDLKNFAKV